MTRLAFRFAKNEKEVHVVLTLNLPLRGLQAGKGGHVTKLRNHKEVKRLQASYTGYMN